MYQFKYNVFFGGRGKQSPMVSHRRTIFKVALIGTDQLKQYHSNNYYGITTPYHCLGHILTYVFTTIS